MRSLLRAQLRLAAAACWSLLGAHSSAALPLLFHLAPGAGRRAPCSGMPLAWVRARRSLVYPLLVVLGWVYVRRAERNERDFADVVGSERPVSHAVTRPRPASSRSSWSPLATLAIGTWGLRFSRTTTDFFVASRTVRPALNASAIGGEYLSAASFLGVAGLVLAFGADMLWYPVGWTAGYLVLLVLVAAPLRRSGAYTLPDFAEARLDSRGGARGLPRCWSWRSAGSTCCRSSRAPG